MYAARWASTAGVSAQASRVRKKALPFHIGRVVIQLHRKLADRAREAVGHVLDATDRLVRETCRDDSRFIDAGSAVLAGKRMRAELKLPIQDVIEMVHGARPLAHPHPAQTASRGRHLSMARQETGLRRAGCTSRLFAFVLHSTFRSRSACAGGAHAAARVSGVAWRCGIPRPPTSSHSNIKNLPSGLP